MGLELTLYVGTFIEIQFNSTPQQFQKNSEYVQKDTMEMRSAQPYKYYDITYNDNVLNKADSFSVYKMNGKTFLVPNDNYFGRFINDESGYISLDENKDDILYKFLQEYEQFYNSIKPYCKSLHIRFGLLKFYW